MLKHTSNASGGGSGGTVSIANGQLRNSSSTTAQPQRSIHLRPPQPLNISTLSATSTTSHLQNSITAPASTAGSNAGPNGAPNGGQRLPLAVTLLNIASSSGGINGAAGGGTGSATTTTPVTPISPSLPNGNAIGVASSLNIGNNLHTYTNQHITTNKTNNNNHSNAANASNIQYSTSNTTGATSNHHNYTNCQSLITTPTPVPAPLPAAATTTIQQTLNKSTHGPGPREALTSLGLLCLVSLLLALLSLIFLLKISPNGRENSGNRIPTEDFIIVYDVTLALCALSLSLNLCCLLVCAIQFLFAVKLLRSPMFDGRDNKYLEKSSVSRTCAVGGFFISIPVFLTGIILYTFNHFHSTPAIITSVLIGIGIVFCGCAMVHNVFVWQKEKTISYRSMPALNMSLISQQFQQLNQSQQHNNIGLITPPAQFLNSNGNPHQLNATTSSHYTTANQCHNLNNPQTHSPMQKLQPQHHHHFSHGTSMTPVSPNHSHGSFNPLLTGALSSSFLIRPATATPPTPKLISGSLPAAQTSIARATSPAGSVSPCQAPTLDMSNITNISLHELSTLV